VFGFCYFALGCFSFQILFEWTCRCLTMPCMFLVFVIWELRHMYAEALQAVMQILAMLLSCWYQTSVPKM